MVWNVIELFENFDTKTESIYKKSGGQWLVET